MRFAISPVHLSKVRRLPRKSEARSHEVLHLSCKIILANLKTWCAKMQPIWGNQRPDLLTSLWWTCLLYCVCHATCIFADPLQMSHACHCFWNCYKDFHVLLILSKVLNPVHLPRKTTASERPKVPRTRQFLTLLRLRNVIRATTAFTSCDISTSESVRRMVCFAHFDFETCFAPQRLALFWHLNFQKCSENGVLCTLWLWHVFRATTARNFSSLIWPDGSAPAPPL